MGSDQSPVAHTRYGDLTVDQLAEIQPGMARLMQEISERAWVLYYAAEAENWGMARHQLGELRKATQIAGLVRPKYRESLAQFDAEFLKPVEEAVRTKDCSAFARAFQRAIAGANESHRNFGYAYIEWQLPATPPPYLRLSARRAEE